MKYSNNNPVKVPEENIEYIYGGKILPILSDKSLWYFRLDMIVGYPKIPKVFHIAASKGRIFRRTYTCSDSYIVCLALGVYYLLICCHFFTLLIRSMRVK